VALVRRCLRRAAYSQRLPRRSCSVAQDAQPGASEKSQGDTMNTIIYIVGLVVIVGVILSYFGLR
jgi:hypothetical protein